MTCGEATVLPALPDVTDAECRDALAAFDHFATRSAFHTSRYRMQFATWGTGPPLIIIHGLADAMRGFAMVMHRLATQFTCIVYTLPTASTKQNSGLTDIGTTQKISSCSSII